jgi:segregation and condensation protein B
MTDRALPQDPVSVASQIEAILFVHGEAMEIKKLASLLTCDIETILRGIRSLQQNAERPEQGITVLEHEGTVQLVTKQEHANVLETLTKQEVKESLTPAALETLSIIAYAGPLTRMEIEYIRGVHSSFTIRNLLIRGLVERKGDPKRPHTYLYFPSADFLKHIGLTRIDELPEYTRYHELRNTFESPPSHETH